jgi:hypothetical protein
MAKIHAGFFKTEGKFEGASLVNAPGEPPDSIELRFKLDNGTVALVTLDVTEAGAVHDKLMRGIEAIKNG